MFDTSCIKCNIAKVLIIIAGCYFAITTGMHYYHGTEDLNKKMQAGTVLLQPRLVHPFELRDEDNKIFTADNLKGQWSILFFGFTSCPMMCPATMAELGKMATILTQNGTPLPQVLMVSVDPARDTVAKMHDYVKHVNKSFKGAVGEKDQIAHLTKELGIVYLASKYQASGNIDHSGTLVLINPKGEVQAFFSFPHAASALAADYQVIVKSLT